MSSEDQTSKQPRITLTMSLNLTPPLLLVVWTVRDILGWLLG